jgi:hypothetical protein
VFNHLDPAIVRECVHIGSTDTVAIIDHSIAKKIARAYSWSWVTCWFAGEGEIGHAIMGDKFMTDPAGNLMHALFGWWHRSAKNPDGPEYEHDEVYVVNAMRDYLLDRVRRGEVGPVEGWAAL